jgi:hypothetical protein
MNNVTFALQQETATSILDAQLRLYRKAQLAWDEARGKIGEAEALAFGKEIFAKYEATKQAYAAIGLTDLGIHNNK